MTELPRAGFILTGDDGSKVTFWPGKDTVFMQIADRHGNIVYINEIQKEAIKQFLDL